MLILGSFCFASRIHLLFIYWKWLNIADQVGRSLHVPVLVELLLTALQFGPSTPVVPRDLLTLTFTYLAEFPVIQQLNKWTIIEPYMLTIKWWGDWISSGKCSQYNLQLTLNLTSYSQGKEFLIVAWKNHLFFLLGQYYQTAFQIVE